MKNPIFSRKPPNNREIVTLIGNYNILQLLTAKSQRSVEDMYMLKESS